MKKFAVLSLLALSAGCGIDPGKQPTSALSQGEAPYSNVRVDRKLAVDGAGNVATDRFSVVPKTAGYRVDVWYKFDPPISRPTSFNAGWVYDPNLEICGSGMIWEMICNVQEAPGAWDGFADANCQQIEQNKIYNARPGAELMLRFGVYRSTDCTGVEPATFEVTATAH